MTEQKLRSRTSATTHAGLNGSSRRSPPASLKDAVRTLTRSVHGGAHMSRGAPHAAHASLCEGSLTVVLRSIGCTLPDSTRGAVARALVSARSERARETIASIALRGAPGLSRIRALSAEDSAKIDRLDPAKVEAILATIASTMAEALEIEGGLTVEDAAELIGLMKSAADASAAANAGAA